MVDRDPSELLTAEEAALAAGLSLPVFQVYVAGGRIRGEPGGFSRASVEELAALHRKAVEHARGEALERLAAEIAVVRGIAVEQGQVGQAVQSHGEQLEKAGKALAEDRASIERHRKAQDALGERAAAQAAEIAGQAERIAALAAELEEAKAGLGHLQDQLLKGLLPGSKLLARSWIGSLSPTKAGEEIAARLAEMREAVDGAAATRDGELAELRGAVAALEAAQKESRQRVETLLERLADAFGQSRPQPPPEPNPNGSGSAKEPPPPKAEPAGGAEPEEPPPPATPPPPAKPGVLREIEFNYLLERMGYKRLDAYSPDELVDARDLPVPNDDRIRSFLARHEMGCPPDEVEIAAVSRGDWHMIQYRRVERRGARRAWIGAKR